MLQAIYLVRHGETEWNREKRYQGRLDSPLTTRGVDQANRTGALLCSLLSSEQDVAIETSPLGRATRTADVIASHLRLPHDHIVTRSLLAECDMGAWQGLTHAEIETRYPGAIDARTRGKWTFREHDGESYADAYDRAVRWLSLPRVARITVAVTHEMLSRTIQGAYLELAPAATLALDHPHGTVIRLLDGHAESFC